MTTEASAIASTRPFERRWASRIPSGALAAIGCAALAIVGSFAGGGGAVEILFPLFAISVAIGFLRRRDHVAFLELLLWLWLISPGLRRIVDYNSGFHEQSTVLATPYLIALIGLPVACRRIQTVSVGSAFAFLAAFFAIGYSTAVGLLLGQPSSVLASLLNWLPPVAAGFFLLMTPQPWTLLRPMLTRVIAIGLVLLGGYALIQWVVVPVWDAAWLQNVVQNVDITGSSFGSPNPYELRVWSLFNGPGPLAGLIVWLLILQAGGRRGALGTIGVVLGVAALAVGGVRAAWLAVILAVFLLTWRGRFNVFRRVGALALASVIFLSIGGFAANQISERVDSLTSGSSDTSAKARISFQAKELPVTLADPIGRGMGSTGAGVRAGSSRTSDGFANPDSGYLEVLRVFGSVGGLILLLAVLIPCVTAFPRTRRADRLVAATGAALATVPLSMVFGSAFGLTTWLGLAIAGRADALATVEPWSAESDVGPAPASPALEAGGDQDPDRGADHTT